MDRLSGLDASFLYLESGSQLMHVCGVIVLDPATIPGGYEFSRFKEELSQRVSGIPMFNRKLKFVPGRIDFPIWVTDDEFDIDRHVHRLAAPVSGQRARADRGRGPPCRDTSRPGAAALGDARDRGAGERQDRGVLQDASRVCRRRLGLQHDLVPVQPRA